MTQKHIKYILENIDEKSITQIAKELRIKEKKITKILKKRKKTTSSSTKVASEKNKSAKFVPIFVVATVVLALKLFMSYHTYGTNDITYWMNFADTIQKYGTFKIYSLIEIYNHPPLISWVLKIVSTLNSATGLPFPFIFRLMPIFADYVSIFIIWKLLEKYGTVRRVFICIICSINPINFFISGFHGNTDPVFVMLILLAIWMVEEDRIAISGMIYGLSMCIKIVPILLLPAFFFYLKDIKKRVIFLASCAAVPATIFLPYIASEYNAIVKNIFLYSSLKGIWGIGHICFSIINNPELSLETRHLFGNIATFQTTYGLAIFIMIISLLLKFFMDKKVLNMTEGAFLTFSVFLTITPGFGVQYLSWLSSFAVMVMPLLGMAYVCIGGFFLFRVYYYWSGGKSPFYANSDIAGQWVGFEKTLDFIVWAIIFTMFVKFLFNTTKVVLSTPRRTPV